MDDRVELLSEEECRRLLGLEQVGRVAVALGALPVIFPVNYVVAGDEVLFFTAEGTKLQAATDNHIVTFEVDHLDPVTRSGWSVLAIGPARERAEPAVVAGAQDAGLHPWAAGDRPHLVAITVEVVSGRRVSAEPDWRDLAPAAPNWVVGPHSPIALLARRPVRVEAACSLGTVADLMSTAGVSSVLVGNDQAIVTGTDVARALRHGSTPETRVGAVATIGLVAVNEDATVVDGAAVMLRHELRHLVVHDHYGHVTGVVGLHDLVRVLLDAMDPAVWVMLRSALAPSSVDLSLLQ
ncbi:MAG TPA: pyridoxamine 5'-phosphate oxidase family protein [Acidimicrobiales bacterium]|nr:pyridoxamine 5'-phosphate oxidase family protein [Acidimicrobiales bacterium]